MKIEGKIPGEYQVELYTLTASGEAKIYDKFGVEVIRSRAGSLSSSESEEEVAKRVFFYDDKKINFLPPLGLEMFVRQNIFQVLIPTSAPSASHSHGQYISKAQEYDPKAGIRTSHFNRLESAINTDLVKGVVLDWDNTMIPFNGIEVLQYISNLGLSIIYLTIRIENILRIQH